MPESHNHVNSEYVEHIIIFFNTIYAIDIDNNFIVLIGYISLLQCFNFVFPPADNGSTTSELETIQERYTSCLKTYVEHTFPMQPNRLQDLLHRLPEVKKKRDLK